MDLTREESEQLILLIDAQISKIERKLKRTKDPFECAVNERWIDCFNDIKFKLQYNMRYSYSDYSEVL